MRGGVKLRLKAIAFVLVFTLVLLTGFIYSQQEKASAAANLSAYMSVVSPNWEPMAYNITGSAPWVDVQTVGGWNAVKLAGNVGIGDGSYRALKNTSTTDIKFADTGSEFMAADISMAPLDVSRMSGYIPVTSANETTKNVPTQNNTTETNSTGKALLSIPAIEAPRFDKNVSEAVNETNASVAKEEAPASPAAPAGMALNDPYHAILMGRPINDLLYEDPLAQSVTMYGRLVGFQLPCGGCANIGIRCIGYGY